MRARVRWARSSRRSWLRGKGHLVGPHKVVGQHSTESQRGAPWAVRSSFCTVAHLISLSCDGLVRAPTHLWALPDRFALLPRLPRGGPYASRWSDRDQCQKLRLSYYTGVDLSALTWRGSSLADTWALFCWPNHNRQIFFFFSLDFLFLIQSMLNDVNF